MGSQSSCQECLPEFMIADDLDIETVSIKCHLNSSLMAIQPNPEYARSVRHIIKLKDVVQYVYRMQSKFNNLEKLQRLSISRGVYRGFYYVFPWKGYYDGEWSHGLPHGHGRVLFDCGAIYQGYFNEGVFESDQALMIFSDGSYYKGGFKQDQAAGLGTFRFQGTIYYGQWHKGVPHGQGIHITLISYFKGEFCYGKFIKQKTNERIFSPSQPANQKTGDQFPQQTNQNLLYEKYQGDFLYDSKMGANTFTWPGKFNNQAKKQTASTEVSEIKIDIR